MCLRPAVDMFLKRAGEHRKGIRDWNIDDAWLAFLRAWDHVRVPEGRGVLESAFERAQAEPITPLRSFGNDYDLVASLAYHFQIFQGDEPILLPVEPIAGLLGKEPMSVTRIIHRMRKDGLLAVVDDHYSYRDGKAKTYRFLFDSGKYEVAATLAEVAA